ncbi:transcriptional regulator domain-containing protein [Novosphingobium sp. CECT 9465]|uniref:transcriptional regulator domain-containing protein n=1 Tax=Novosphingobium sp. CECT 9465 TaxID=2829794 RepID=UPI0035302D0D
MSPVSDWREENPSRPRDAFDLSGIAFEFLRRNPDYQRDFALAQGNPGVSQTEEDARTASRWGLRFPGRPGPSCFGRTAALAG